MLFTKNINLLRTIFRNIVLIQPIAAMNGCVGRNKTIKNVYSKKEKKVQLQCVRYLSVIKLKEKTTLFEKQNNF